MLKKVLMAAVAGWAFSAAAATAAPITTPPPIITANGDVNAIYVFADAGDTSNLNEVSPFSIPQIFCNHSNGGCTAGAPGQITDIGLTTGPIVFSLNNTSMGTTYLSNVADSDGIYHALITTNYLDFGLGALTGDAATAIQTYLDLGQTVTFVGWEDRNLAENSDFDYNDLIFAFANTVSRTSVPEPLTLSIFGAGLVGAATLRRRRKAQKA